MTEVVAQKLNPGSGGTLTDEGSAYWWTVRAAQTCEQLWNESGRASARLFIEEHSGLPELKKILKSSDSLVRSKALYLMSFLESPDLVDEFTRVLRTDPCPVVRHEAAYFLGIMHDQRAVDALGAALTKDGDEIVRHEAAEALGELGMASGLQWLDSAISDPSPVVRRTVEIAQTHIRMSLNQRNDGAQHTIESLSLTSRF